MKHTEQVTIKRIGAPESFGNSTKQTLVGTTDGKYPQTLAFDFWGERMDAVQAVRIGQRVKVTFEVRGKEGSNDRVWTSLNGFSAVVEQQDKPDTPCDMTGYGSEASRIPEPAELVNDVMPF